VRRCGCFNTNIGLVDTRFFQGLPSPAAAAMVIGLVWVMDDFGYKGVEHIPWLAWTAFGFTVYAGLTMVTNVPFYSFKDISFRRSVPFIVIVAIALAFAVVAYDPPRVLFGLFVLYGLSGYVVYLVKKSRGKPVSVIAVSTDEPDEQGLHQ
jgi:CDP-diacylglycerol--serine O-phosphatidyltransferase